MTTLCLLTLLGPGCAVLGSLASGKAPSASAIASDAARVAELGKKATAHAEALCQPLLAQAPSFAEERAIGGVVGVELISNSGPMCLAGLPEKDPRKLTEALEKKQPIALADNARDELTASIAIVGRNPLGTPPDQIALTFAVIQNDRQRVQRPEGTGDHHRPLRR